MKLENLVCAKEYSEKLCKLGVKQESLWWWDLRRKKEDCDVGDKPKDEWILSYEECYQGDRDDLISAFTVAELGEMLPDNYITKRLGKMWIGANYDFIDWLVKADTEANARAKMLIYLKERK